LAHRRAPTGWPPEARKKSRLARLVVSEVAEQARRGGCRAPRPSGPRSESGGLVAAAANPRPRITVAAPATRPASAIQAGQARAYCRPNSLAVRPAAADPPAPAEPAGGSVRSPRAPDAGREKRGSPSPRAREKAAPRDRVLGLFLPTRAAVDEQKPPPCLRGSGLVVLWPRVKNEPRHPPRSSSARRSRSYSPPGFVLEEVLVDLARRARDEGAPRRRAENRGSAGSKGSGAP